MQGRRRRNSPAVREISGKTKVQMTEKASADKNGREGGEGDDKDKKRSQGGKDAKGKKHWKKVTTVSVKMLLQTGHRLIDDSDVLYGRDFEDETFSFGEVSRQRWVVIITVRCARRPEIRNEKTIIIFAIWVDSIQ